jgi:cellulose synthase/poly-beta-1,6-N-acetylglucosamine synthase-like glycosyltransferase
MESPCEVSTMKSNEYQAQMDPILFNGLTDNYIDKDEVTVLIPTLNEEKGIELVLKDVLLAGYQNVMVIDGHSIDDTAKLVKKLNVVVYP